MSEPALTPELADWIYGPPSDEDDEPPSTGELYHQQEEEDRFRWIPGYRALVEEYLAELRKWHASWVGGSDYPPEPPRVTELKGRISEYQKARARPPWEVK